MPDPPTTRDRLQQSARAELEACGHAGVSLRAVARRAGVSHAAPKNHFGDRAGLLTAVATDGFTRLTDGMGGVAQEDPARRLVALGRVYLDYGLAHPALFDLMFRPSELHADDPALREAQAASIQALAATAAELRADVPAETLTLMAWALVHGLVALVRDGVLVPPDHPEPAADVAAGVAAAFTGLVTGGAPR